MTRYVINVLASRDLTEISDYFAETNMEVGERFFREFNSKCKQLVFFQAVVKAMRQFDRICEDYRSKVILFSTGFLMMGSKLSGRRNLPSLFEEPN